MKRWPCLVTNNIPHTIYSGGNIVVTCRKTKLEKNDQLTDFYLKIIIEFQTIFKLNRKVVVGTK